MLSFFSYSSFNFAKVTHFTVFVHIFLFIAKGKNSIKALCLCVIYASVVVKLRLCLVRFRIGELVQWFPLVSERAHTKESRWPAGLCLQISAFYFSDSLLSVAARLQSPHQLAFFLLAAHTYTHTHKGPINYQISQP